MIMKTVKLGYRWDNMIFSLVWINTHIQQKGEANSKLKYNILALDTDKLLIQIYSVTFYQRIFNS